MTQQRKEVNKMQGVSIKWARRIAKQYGRLCHEITELYVMNGWYQVRFGQGMKLVGKMRELGK